MYFIPKVNQNIHKSTGHLEKDIKLMKKIDLTICLEKFIFFSIFGNGSDNSLAFVDFLSNDGEILVHYKIAYDECISCSEKNSGYIEFEYSPHFLENLPLVAFFKENVNFRKSIHLHLIGIPSTYLEKFQADDILLMFDYPVCDVKIFDSGDYIIYTICILFVCLFLSFTC